MPQIRIIVLTMYFFHFAFFTPKCFHIPYVVENFPMKERTDEELKELKRVVQQKKIETECLKVQF